MGLLYVLTAFDLFRGDRTPYHQDFPGTLEAYTIPSIPSQHTYTENRRPLPPLVPMVPPEGYPLRNHQKSVVGSSRAQKTLNM